jgi:hypothetical protein
LIAGADVVQLDDGRMRERADNSSFSEKLLFATLAEAGDECFQRDGAANERVVSFLDTARRSTT